MKIKICLMALSATFMLSSCITTVKTARSADTSASINNATVADLNVTDHRITYTMTPSKEIQRAGLANVKQAAIQEALTANGNADVMVEPEFVISMKNKFILGKEVSSITVTGRPAYYKNFRTLNDSVWATPGFLGQPNRSAGYGYNSKKSGGTLGAILGVFSGKKAKEAKSYGNNYGYSYDVNSGFGAKIEAVGGIQRLKDSDSSEKTKTHPYAGGYVTLGYHVIPNLFIGAGTGCTWDFERAFALLPVYGYARFNFSPYREGFYVDLKVGGSTMLNDSEFDGGAFVNPSIGYSFGHVDIAFSWMTQHVKGERKYFGGYKPEGDVTRIGLSLGVTL